MTPLKFLVGGYSNIITALIFTPSTPYSGSISLLTTSPAGQSPSWLGFHPMNDSVLYAVNSQTTSLLRSFTFDKNTGSAVSIATTGSGGLNPVHFVPLKSGNEIYMANYGGGTGLGVNLGSDLTSFASSDEVNVFSAAVSHPHQVVEYGDELLIPDLGADQVWRLTKSSTGSWIVNSSIPQTVGSGPRHAVAVDSTLYTLHELSNELTQHTLPPLGSGTSPQLISTLSIAPPGANISALAAGELLLSPTNRIYHSQYLYATNRNDPDPAGDAIAIFSTKPTLKLVKHVRTGLKHIRAAAIGGTHGEYLVAGGRNGGGIVVYKRVNGGKDLLELARYTDPLDQPSSFVFF